MQDKAKLLAGLVAAAAVSMAAAHPALAVDWWLIGENVDGARTYSDADSLRCTLNKCSVWERIIPAAKTADARVVDSLAQYDCEGDWTATKAEVTYTPTMQRLSFAEAASPKWALIEAGTMGKDSVAFACRADVADLPRTAGQTVVVDDKLFVRDVSIRTPPPDIIGLGSESPAIPSVPRSASSARIAAAEAASRPPAGGGQAYAAQIGAVTSWSAAQRLERRFESSLPQLRPGLKMTIEQAVVDGRTVYRAVVLGFTSSMDAQAFCDGLRLSRQGCLVRGADAG